jgi:hypothetical protein
MITRMLSEEWPESLKFPKGYQIWQHLLLNVYFDDSLQTSNSYGHIINISLYLFETDN